jgi:hypothetical protein
MEITSEIDKHGIKVRETKGMTIDDVDCTNCKNLYKVEASGGICRIKEVQVGNDNYCDLFESVYDSNNFNVFMIF